MNTPGETGTLDWLRDKASSAVVVSALAGLVAGAAPTETDAKCRITKCGVDEVFHSYTDCKGEKFCSCRPDDQALRGKIDKLTNDNSKLGEDNSRLNLDNARLNAEITRLTAEIETLKSKLETSGKLADSLRAEIEGLKAQILALNLKVGSLEEQNSGLRALVSKLQEVNGLLEARIAGLTKQDGLKFFADTAVALYVRDNERAPSCGDGCEPVKYKRSSMPVVTSVGLRYELLNRSGTAGISPGVVGNVIVGSDGEVYGGGGIEARATFLPAGDVFEISATVRGLLESNSKGSVDPNFEARFGVGARFGGIGEVEAVVGYDRIVPNGQVNVPSLGVGVSVKFPGTEAR